MPGAGAPTSRLALAMCRATSLHVSIVPPPNPSRLKALSQTVAGPEQQYAKIARRDVEHPTDLVGGEVVDLSEHKCMAAALGEAGETLADPGANPIGIGACVRRARTAAPATEGGESGINHLVDGIGLQFAIRGAPQ